MAKSASDDPYIQRTRGQFGTPRIGGSGYTSGVGSSSARPTFADRQMTTSSTPELERGGGEGGDGFGWGDAASTLGSLFGGAKDALGLTGINPLLLALVGLQGWNAAELSKKGTGYAEDAFKGVSDDYTTRAPLRRAGLQGMLDPQHADLSELTSIRRALPGASSVGITGATPTNPGPLPFDPNIPPAPGGPAPGPMPMPIDLGTRLRDRMKTPRLRDRMTNPPTIDVAGKGGIPSQSTLSGMMEQAKNGTLPTSSPIPDMTSVAGSGGIPSTSRLQDLLNKARQGKPGGTFGRFGV